MYLDPKKKVYVGFVCAGFRDVLRDHGKTTKATHKVDFGLVYTYT